MICYSVRDRYVWNDPCCFPTTKLTTLHRNQVLVPLILRDHILFSYTNHSCFYSIQNHILFLLWLFYFIGSELHNDSSPSSIFPPLFNASRFYYLIWKIKRDFCNAPLDLENEPGNSEPLCRYLMWKATFKWKWWPVPALRRFTGESMWSNKEKLNQTEAHCQTMPNLLQYLHNEFLLLLNDL